MIYLDANVFIYAYLKPRSKNPDPKSLWMKQQAKNIIQELNASDGTNIKFGLSLIQLSEIVNIIKDSFTWDQLYTFLMGIYSNPSIEIFEVSKNVYLNAIDKIRDYGMDPNDLSAFLIMQEHGIKEIYTFDKKFETLPEIMCVAPKYLENTE